jgi:hypothetical protein
MRTPALKSEADLLFRHDSLRHFHPIARDRSERSTEPTVRIVTEHLAVIIGANGQDATHHAALPAANIHAHQPDYSIASTRPAP